MSLDQKLVSLISEHDQSDTYGTEQMEKAISDFKQAFADEGWTHKPFSLT